MASHKITTQFFNIGKLNQSLNHAQNFISLVGVIFNAIRWKSGTHDSDGDNGLVKIGNKHLAKIKPDFLYHINLDTESTNLEQAFGDVKYVVCGGTPKRMEKFAKFIMERLGVKSPVGYSLSDISAAGNRYAMFKTGPVLSVSHGMGNPSMGILLSELVKLMHYAKCKNPVFLRMGTCGGVGVDGGTVVITDQAYDGLLRPCFETKVLGKSKKRPTQLDPKLIDELKALADADDNDYKTIVGNTLCADDFYEGQARRDGPFTEIKNSEKIAFFKKLKDFDIVNIEMESTSFAGLTSDANIKSAVVSVVLLNRVKGDQIDVPPEELAKWQERPMHLIVKYIQKNMNDTKQNKKNKKQPLQIDCEEGSDDSEGSEGSEGSEDEQCEDGGKGQKGEKGHK